MEAVIFGMFIVACRCAVLQRTPYRDLAARLVWLFDPDLEDAHRRWHIAPVWWN